MIHFPLLDRRSEPTHARMECTDPPNVAIWASGVSILRNQYYR